MKTATAKPLSARGSEPELKQMRFSRPLLASLFLAVLLLAAVLRFYDLGHAAVRSDEIAFLFRAMQNESLVELWKNPPWLNQIPFSETVAILWTRWTGQTASEAVVRQPFAWMGWVTVAYLMGWLWRRRGAGAALLAGAWLAVLPYHVYHSREAYYYIQVMLFAAGMALRGADFTLRLRQGQRLNLREYSEWAAWALLACLTHMSAWVVAALTGLFLAWAGWKGLAGAERRRHAWAVGGLVLFLGLGMSRWVFRAFLEMQRVSTAGHIGSSFALVGPRVLPVFAGGANAWGWGILAMVLLAAGWILWRTRGRPGREDPLYGLVARLAWSWLAVTFTYIFFVGGGEKAKLTYFAANLPIFLVWAALTLDKAGGRTRRAWQLAAPLILCAVLLPAAIQVTRLDGKPTPYRKIQAWLDQNLAPGDVVVVDRWFEPWNEMALYAPTNVFVTSPQPDEPFENYLRGNWRQAATNLFARNGAQAFIRVSRIYENRLGLWTWPETWFRHRAVVTNTAGLWLRDTGFIPMEEFYSETNRVLTEIFYDTHADIVERARTAGRELVWFFGAGWKLFKPWQQGDYADYRVVEEAAAMTIHNLRATPVRAVATVTAVSAGSTPATVRIGTAAPMTFPGGQLTRKTAELELPPGASSLACEKTGAGQALLVREFTLAPVP